MALRPIAIFKLGLNGVSFIYGNTHNHEKEMPMKKHIDYLVYVVDPAIFLQTEPTDILSVEHPSAGWGGRAFFL